MSYISIKVYGLKYLNLFFVWTASDVAGEVVEVGFEVKNFKAGDKVVALLNAFVRFIRVACLVLILCTSICLLDLFLVFSTRYLSCQEQILWSKNYEGTFVYGYSFVT